MGFEFIRQIDAGEVESLAGVYRRAVCDYDRESIRGKLDGIANGIKFGDMMLTGENGAHRDVAIGILAGHGAGSFAEFMHGDDGPIASQASCRQPGDYESGLLRLGIPPQEVDIISAALLQSGKLPSTLFNAVIYGQLRIRGLHPDKRPWPPQVFDYVSHGLSEAESVDSDGVWRHAKAFLEARGRPELAQLYEGAGTPSDALAVLFEDYALSMFHDVNRLRSEGREVHF